MMIVMGGEKPPAIAYQDRQLRANQSSVERGHAWVSWCSELIPTRMVFECVHFAALSSRTAETVVDRKEAVSAGIVPPIFNNPGLCPN